MTFAYGARLALAHIGRAQDDFGLKFKSYDFNGDRSCTVRCPAGHRTMCEKSKELSKISIQIGRCFMSPTATGEKRRVFAEVHIESV